MIDLFMSYSEYISGESINMEKVIDLNGKTVTYSLERKKVKNINLRIGADGRVSVSANRWVSEKTIESFLCSKENFIFGALQKAEERAKIPPVQYFNEKEIRYLILELCERIYPVFEARGVRFPQVKFRKMKTQWGNCHPQKGVLTFNTRLMYAPRECVEYVVAHEFTHFLQPNHSALFYAELEKVMPDWKERRKKLKSISV